MSHEEQQQSRFLDRRFWRSKKHHFEEIILSILSTKLGKKITESRMRLGDVSGLYKVSNLNHLRPFKQGHGYSEGLPVVEMDSAVTSSGIWMEETFRDVAKRTYLVHRYTLYSSSIEFRS